MSKRIKFEIIPGKMCTMDPKNILGDDSTGTCLVCVTELVKYKPFGKSIWKVEDIENGIILEVSENILYPAGMSIVRRDPNMPIFNESDIESLNWAIGKLENSAENKRTVDRLKALKEKINVSIKVEEV